ncbi:MAG: 6-phosphogluconolactonase [Thiomicrorhabdus sp.]|nr:6-phosphogluconolactonase [Thiomicrorhabdus sp.]
MALVLPDNWCVFDDAESLAQQLVAEILQIAEHAIQETGAFHFITAGGSTPNRCYQLLAECQADWKHWHIYMGDERVLPFNHPERNSQALLNNWLNKNEIPAKNIHFINTEAGAEKSAKAYANTVASVQQFDLCLLGMGEDGHTASLFPGHENGASVQELTVQAISDTWAPIIIENNSPKPPAQRVSLSYAALNRCNLVIKLVTGNTKRLAVNQWLTAQNELPIKKVHGEQTKVYVSQDALPVDL